MFFCTGADLVKEMIISCQKYGLKLGFFYSVHFNWFLGVDGYKVVSAQEEFGLSFFFISCLVSCFVSVMLHSMLHSRSIDRMTAILYAGPPATGPKEIHAGGVPSHC